MYPSAVFFSTSEEAVSSCKRISIDTLGKTALKCGNLPSLTVIRPKRAKILPHKVAKVFRRLFRGGGGGTNMHPTVKTSVKFHDFAVRCVH